MYSTHCARFKSIVQITRILLIVKQNMYVKHVCIIIVYCSSNIVRQVVTGTNYQCIDDVFLGFCFRGHSLSTSLNRSVFVRLRYCHLCILAFPELPKSRFVVNNNFSL